MVKRSLTRNDAESSTVNDEAKALPTLPVPKVTVAGPGGNNDTTGPSFESQSSVVLFSPRHQLTRPDGAGTHWASAGERASETQIKTATKTRITSEQTGRVGADVFIQIRDERGSLS